MFTCTKERQLSGNGGAASLTGRKENGASDKTETP